MKSKLITEIVIPFDNDNNIDINVYKRLIKDVVLQGSDGIVVGATIGEEKSLSSNEIIDMISIANECSNCEKIINITTRDFDETINLIKRLEKHKHEALMILFPDFNNLNDDFLYNSLKKIVNMYKYENFILCKDSNKDIVELSSNCFFKLIDEFPNIIGLKYADNDYEFIDKLKQKYPQFIVYSGDVDILEILKHGGNGAISIVSHIFGLQIKELIDDYFNSIENDILNEYIKNIRDILICDSTSIKYALSKLGYESMNTMGKMVDLELSKCKNIDFILNI